MKKGFALLETLVVVIVLCVSLLMLYTTFTNMVNNSNKNIIYDDMASIYKTYYVKEYLSLNNLSSYLDKEFKELDCSDFNTSCNTLFKELNIHKIYISDYDSKNIDKTNLEEPLQDYLKSLSNKEDYSYRFIVEFNYKNSYSYASIGLNGD